MFSKLYEITKTKSSVNPSFSKDVATRYELYKLAIRFLPTSFLPFFRFGTSHISRLHDTQYLRGRSYIM